MNRLMGVVRIVCGIAGPAGVAVAAGASIAASAFAMRGDGRGRPRGPTDRRCRAGFPCVFSLAVAGYGAGIRRHRGRP